MRTIASIIALSAAAPAFAGNIEPVAPAPVIIAPAAPVLSFAGGYAGGSVGFGNLDADTDLGLGGDLDGDGDDDDDDDNLTNQILGSFDLDETDVAYGVHAGYNFQNGNVVWGPELAIFGSNAELGGGFDANADGDDDLSVDIELDYGVRLALRGGYALGPNLIYGTLGAAYLDMSLGLEGAEGPDGDGDVGYAAGFGYERLVTDNFSVGAQYTLHSIDDFDFGDGEDGTDVDYRVLELRGSFKF